VYEVCIKVVIHHGTNVCKICKILVPYHIRQMSLRCNRISHKTCYASNSNYFYLGKLLSVLKKCKNESCANSILTFWSYIDKHKSYTYCYVPCMYIFPFMVVLIKGYDTNIYNHLKIVGLNVCMKRICWQDSCNRH